MRPKRRTSIRVVPHTIDTQLDVEVLSP
jgi:hypothetical protein